jgi:hypothetical protein
LTFTDIPQGRVIERRGLIRERVLRILLNNPSGNLSKYRVAKLSGGAYPWIHEILGNLEREGLVKGTRVESFSGLIARWQKWRVEPKVREYMLRKPLDVLTKATLSFALTTYQAENLVQNYLFPSRVDFYINPAELLKWHDRLTREGLVGRGNTRVLIGDRQVFYNASDRSGLKVVSIPQLIVDRLAEGGVCVEAAEMLMEKESKKIGALPGL